MFSCGVFAESTCAETLRYDLWLTILHTFHSHNSIGQKWISISESEFRIKFYFHFVAVKWCFCVIFLICLKIQTRKWIWRLSDNFISLLFIQIACIVNRDNSRKRDQNLAIKCRNYLLICAFVSVWSLIRNNYNQFLTRRSLQCH